MHSFRYQAHKLLQLTMPVFIGQLTQTMMGFIDAVMAGSVSHVDMAAVALGTSIWFPTLLFVLGLLMPLTPIVSHHLGGNELKKIKPTVWQGLYVAFIFGFVSMGVLYLSPMIFEKLEVQAEMYQLAQGYLHSFLWGAPAFAAFQVLKSCSEGMHHTFPTMLFGIIAMLLNIPLNYIFIYGHLGAPAMGGAGCGVASAIICWVMFLCMAVYLHKHPYFKKIGLFRGWIAFDFKSILGIIRLGLPVAMSTFFEVTLFATVALFVAPLGAVVVASHQIAINFSSLAFMMPLSIGIAISIRVGYYLGHNQSKRAFQSIYAALAIGLIFASFAALITALFRAQVIGLYTDNAEVTQIAMSLLYLAALYQLSDSIQVISAGALRGFGDTKSAFYITLFSYWCVGLALGYTLALTDRIVEPMGVTGFWVGILTGLSCAAVLFIGRLLYIKKHHNEYKTGY
jgi:MATE family multidrug resistance protein